MVRVIGVGDNTVDKYQDLRMMFPGGNTVNVAVLARRYGHPASYIGWLGDDEHGRLILNALRQERVDTSHCRVVDGPNACGEIFLVDGDRVFGQSDAGVSDRLALTEADLHFVGQHDLAHTSIYSHIERDLPKLSGAARHLSFDFSDEWKRDYLADRLPWVDTAIVSYPHRPEAEIKDLMRWMQAQGPACVLVTQGKAGAAAYDGARFYRQSIVETEVLDTLGAGDAFIARFLVERLSGAATEAALAAAAASAAETCRYYGAFGHGIAY
ncbi:MAG: fructoselysine 6-kinase [Chloroflexota bacterium]